MKKFNDIDTQDKVKDFLENMPSSFRNEIPYHDERDLNTLLRVLIKNKVKVEVSTLMPFLHKFIRASKSKRENTESLLHAFSGPLSDLDFQELVNQSSPDIKKNLGLSPQENINCGKDKVKIINKMIDNKEIFSIAYVTLSFQTTSMEELEEIKSKQVDQGYIKTDSVYKPRESWMFLIPSLKDLKDVLQGINLKIEDWTPRMLFYSKLL